MFVLGPIGFATPWLLLGLVALPILWILLRAVPPAPIRRRFPGVALLLGLQDNDTTADKTPWWLLLLRMVAIASAIIAFAGPVLNPVQRAGGSGPLLVLIDGTWADARDWPRRIERATALVEEAGRQGRPVAVVRLTDTPQPIAFQAADAVTGRIAALTPEPWGPTDLPGWVESLPEDGFDSFWLSDGLDHPGRDDLRAALDDQGDLTVFQSPRPVLALHPARFADGTIQIAASRLPAGDGVTVEVIARGPDPAGIDRELARTPLTFAIGAARAEGTLDLPAELRNRITRLEVEGIRSAAAVSLTDDSLKRRKIAIIGGGADAEELQLLSPTHYLEQALAPTSDLIDATLTDALQASPDVVILADVARLAQAEQDRLTDWVEEGGMLVRFAGPRMAASDVARDGTDPLMPVRLREGGRSVGGAMSWGDPKALAPFAEGSPFHGLALPADLTVTSQVLAQPDPDLAARTVAALTDGTPLVTRNTLGAGQVVLFHVTANADWSNLPLTGLFPAMLERLAVSTRPAAPTEGDLTGQIFTLDSRLDAYGQPQDAGTVAGVPGADLSAALTAGPSPATPPGLYAGDDRRVALNVIGADTVLAAAAWPAGTPVEGMEAPPERALKGWFLTGALALLLADILAALAVSGKLGRGAVRAGLVLLAISAAAPPPAQAQDTTTDAETTAELPLDPAFEAFAEQATGAVVLAHVLTGDPTVDDMAQAGLQGLGMKLFERTSVEPASPMGVNPETDELSFFPFLYWPVTADAPELSAAAADRLNGYLRTGGMILFDTRDADMSRGGTTPEGAALQRIAAALDIPPLEPVPQDHVLTRSFYLLTDFPGRFQNGQTWAEAAPPDAEQIEGMPFRNLNDGVTPVVIGGNDWAAAWAVDNRGIALYPVGRGFAGERQREMAYRFGINLIMHVLTGNYKSDQVHVPALLERLGQ
jgi:hypothetical protein